MLNPSAESELTENYRLSTEKARQWWNNQAFESRKNIVIESDAVINDDQEVEDQIVADVADSDYDELPDETKQEIDSQIDEEEDIEEIFEVQGEEYLQCSKCDDLFTSNEDHDIHKSVDHGEEPEDFEESEETYQLTMNPDLTREALREANSLLTETEEKELYGGYDKTGKIQSSVMPYNVPAKATGKYNDNPNEFFYSNKIFRNGSSTERNSALGESKANEDGYTTKDDPAICPNCNSDSFGYIMNGQRYEFEDVQSNGKVKCDSCGGEFTPRELVTIADGYYTEAKASEEFDISKYYKEIVEDGWMDYQCNSCGKKFDPDDGYGDQKDYGVLIQELKDHQINHKFVYESKASEWGVNTNDLWGGNMSEDQAAMADGLADLQSMDKRFCKICGAEDYEHRSQHPSNWGDMSHAGNPDMGNQSNFGQITDHVFVLDYNRLNESKATEVPISDSDTNGLVWTCPKCSQQINYDTVMNKKLISYHLRSMHGLSDEQVINLLQKDFQNDWEIQRILMSGESKASEDDYEERAEWNWLTNKDPAPEVDYGQVDYEDDGVSDISVPNAEPKDDKNEFLDDVDIKLEEVNFVYPTKSNESTKSYITESEPFDEEYEEFEDSDEEIIEETISIRKLTGYSDNSIAQELHINYGVSHEEALEKVYSVEVSTNDKVAQTFFGKMYKECTESEKDELRMYSGSD